METSLAIVTLLVFLPIVGGGISYFTRHRQPQWMSFGFILAGFVLSVINLVLLGDPVIRSWSWIGDIRIGLMVDHINAVLIALVYFIGLMVSLFSITYMEEDKGISRYFLLLGFFISSMIGLLVANDLVGFFLFWELVGLTSYLLIGFWYNEEKRSNAARASFMINRVADAFLLIGILSLFVEGYPTSFSEISLADIQMNDVSGLCLILGAFGKSAQFPFSGWLIKAMVGPTPVSALIHAATMVTAGVYFLFRVQGVLPEWNLIFIAWGGGLTALIGGVAALTQFDIKKVLAYSTISQLGFMILGIGVGAYQASVFHLWTHAFFKAGLFLAAGAVIHYMHYLYKGKSIDVQDMRNMGGLNKVLPVTFYTFIVCGLALSGLPLLSGFLSKEGILVGALHFGIEKNQWGIPIIILISAFLTPIYIGRQIVLIFIRKAPRFEKIYEPWITVRVPLLILALGTLWFWNSANPFNPSGWMMGKFLFGNTGDPHHFNWVVYFSIFLTLIGLGLVLWLYRPSSVRIKTFKDAADPIYFLGKVSFHGFYLEKAYATVESTFVWWTLQAGRFDKKIIDWSVEMVGISTVVLSKMTGWFDQYIVDGFVNFLAFLSKVVGRFFVGFQAPQLQKQLTWLLVGILGIFLWFHFAT